VLARVQSPTVAQLMGLMLPPSDNFFAETLLKDLGARFGGAGSTAAGAAVISQTISSLLGIHARVVDGSGLSPANQTSPLQAAQLLVQLAQTPIGSVLRESLAVAGRSGTLKRRMRGTGAAGRCVGKTGTLTGVSNLVGYCQAAGGHLLAFAIFTDGIPTLSAHRFQDHIVITLADSKIGASGEAARHGSALLPSSAISR
jgi:D-alanyl-D-alanine carboxypeptidase/D-alanyl-D-alanine-endopeptidase (penicillin-binding protein 4)